MGEIDRAGQESSEQLEGLLNMELMGQIGAKIEEHLSDYVEKDSGLFNMTKIWYCIPILKSKIFDDRPFIRQIWIKLHYDNALIEAKGIKFFEWSYKKK